MFKRQHGSVYMTRPETGASQAANDDDDSGCMTGVFVTSGSDATTTTTATPTTSDGYPDGYAGGGRAAGEAAVDFSACATDVFSGRGNRETMAVGNGSMAVGDDGALGSCGDIGISDDETVGENGVAGYLNSVYADTATSGPIVGDVFPTHSATGKGDEENGERHPSARVPTARTEEEPGEEGGEGIVFLEDGSDDQLPVFTMLLAPDNDEHGGDVLADNSNGLVTEFMAPLAGECTEMLGSPEKGKSISGGGGGGGLGQKGKSYIFRQSSGDLLSLLAQELLRQDDIETDEGNALAETKALELRASPRGFVATQG